MSIHIDLTDFDDDDIVEYAEEQLGMFKEQNHISDTDTDDLLEELSFRGVSLFEFETPHNIMSKDLLERLYNNIDKVNLTELKQFLNKRGI